MAEVRWLEPALGLLRGDRERVGARKQPSPHRAGPNYSAKGAGVVAEVLGGGWEVSQESWV